MELILQNIIEELQSMLNKAKNLEAQYIGEILALQKVVNITHKTAPQVSKKQVAKKEEMKQEITKEEAQNKVDALLSQIDLMQKNIESDSRPKFEVKRPQVIVEKKPPIPTVNRNQKSSKTTFPSYVPPKNRNQVTGKVTQTTVKTSAQKVFKPELTGTKRSGSRDIISNKNTIIKGRQSTDSKLQKKIEKKEESLQHKTQQPQLSEIPFKKIEQQQKKIAKAQEKILVVCQKDPLQTFNKPIQELLQEFSSRGQKNRKTILQKMIKEYENEELGHKKNEQSSRMTFIKHAHNYSASRNQVHPVITHKIQRQKWQYYPELFELQYLLQNLDSEIKNLGNLKQYRIDPRQEYKICQTAKKLQKIIQKIDQDKGIVPDQLSLNYYYAEISASSDDVEEKDVNVINEIQINEGFLKLLHSISESNTLQKQELRGLQVLAEVGLFKCKKSPVLVTESEYQGWSEHYFSDV